MSNKIPKCSAEDSQRFQDLLSRSVRAAAVLGCASDFVVVPFDWSDGRANAALREAANRGLKFAGLVALLPDPPRGLLVSEPLNEPWAVRACLQAKDEFACLIVAEVTAARMVHAVMSN